MTPCPGTGRPVIRRGGDWYRCPECGDAFRGRGEFVRRHVATGTMTQSAADGGKEGKS